MAEDDAWNRFGAGIRVEACYLPQTISGYEGNPLIEALPPILSTEQVAACLAHYPDYEEGYRKMPEGHRIHLAANCLEFFAPLDIHIDLEQRFACLIRSGYKARNPILTNQSLAVERRIKNLNLQWVSQYSNRSSYRPTTAIGFNMVGISGVGKSQILERIFSLYPQVIDHSSYAGQSLHESQLVWMKLDCPFDSSLKWLCMNFFNTVDAAIGTTYSASHASGRRTVDEMLQKMALVAANHHLGVLVIDEIGRLRGANGDGAERMLDFFVQLVNTIGVPVVLVGNYKALDVIAGNFSQLRRGAGQGDLIWRQMEFGRQWDGFLEVLWKFQVTRHQSPLTPAISTLLYDLPQGITDLVVKTYLLAQQYAIQTGTERVNEDVICSAYESKFQILQPVLRALREGTKASLSAYEDVYHRMLETFPYSEHVSTLFELPMPNRGATGKEPIGITESVTETESVIAAPKTKPRRPAKVKKSVSKGLLPQVGADTPRNRERPDGQESGENEIYNAIQSHGLIYQADDFLSANES